MFQPVEAGDTLFSHTNSGKGIRKKFNWNILIHRINIRK